MDFVGGQSSSSRRAPARVRKRVIHLPPVTTQNPYDINWAEVAARAKADLGDEQITRFSDRFRMIVMVAADALRPGDTEGLRFGEPTLGA